MGGPKNKLFGDVKVRCARGHPMPFSTGLKSHDVGTVNRQAKPGIQFETASLIGVSGERPQTMKRSTPLESG
jgi:hypothetical protein